MFIVGLQRPFLIGLNFDLFFSSLCLLDVALMSDIPIKVKVFGSFFAVFVAVVIVVLVVVKSCYSYCFSLSP